MMLVDVTEFAQNLDDYLNLVADEDILITQEGKVVARLSDVNQARRALADSLVGIIPDDVTLEEALEERAQEL